MSFIIRSNNLMNLKWAVYLPPSTRLSLHHHKLIHFLQIIKRQPALFPGVEMVANDIKMVSRWTPPHFAEPCIRNKDLKMIPDGGVVFWSRGPSIPRRNITLDVRGTNTTLLPFFFLFLVFIFVPFFFFLSHF